MRILLTALGPYFDMPVTPAEFILRGIRTNDFLEDEALRAGVARACLHLVPRCRLVETGPDELGAEIPSNADVECLQGAYL